jgi:hypothetical protein
VPLAAPLNPRQIAVLRWINEGCPGGRWNDFAYKTVAVALQSRRLVSVSKRDGRWTAKIAEAGIHYLEHGDFPPGHFPKQRHYQHRVTAAQPSAVSQDSRQSGNAAVRLPPERVTDEQPSSTPPIRPARALLDEVLAAGGEIRRESRLLRHHESIVGIQHCVCCVRRRCSARPRRQSNEFFESCRQ